MKTFTWFLQKLGWRLAWLFPGLAMRVRRRRRLRRERVPYKATIHPRDVLGPNEEE